MQLDAFTLVAQMVNFLILVYLLKRFLYRPVLAAMERRETTISTRLQEAADREQAASETIADYQTKTDALAQQRQQWLAQITTEVEDERSKQLQAAQDDIEQRRQHWQRELIREQGQLSQDIRQQLSYNACQLSRQMLSDLADTELENQLITVLLQKIQKLSPDQQQTLAQSCRITGAEIVVNSSFTLTAAQQQRLRAALQDLLDQPGLLLEFRQQQELICGIRLDTPQQTLSWSINEYLAQYEEQLRATVN